MEVRVAVGSFATSKDAKLFLVERAVAQAADEGAPLTPAETQMLAFSVEDEEFDETLEARFENEHSVSGYEAKMTGLLERALRRDRESGRGAEARWNEAYELLRREDHYLLVMLKPVVRPGLSDKLWMRLGPKSESKVTPGGM